MAHLTALKRKAKQLGATVEVKTFGLNVICQVEAPAGKVWACTGDIHALMTEWRKDEPEYRQASIVDALERMAEGLTDCDNPDCDYCHPEEEMP